MKSAFITGGNRGIGLETARQLTRLGYRVIISSRDEAAGKVAVASLEKEGLKVECVAMDVTKDDSVAAAAKAVSAKLGGSLDALINNAGYAAAPGSEQVSLAEMTKSYDINVVGTVRVVNNFLELVKKSSAGRIVNLSSIMGSNELAVAPIAFSPYNASKAALNRYTVDLANALKESNIKVNAAHPGWVKTEMGGAGADLEIPEGAETSVYLATLPADGPTGGFFHKKDRLPW